MTIVKVIEVIAEGKSLENAMESALRDANQTVSNIKQIDVGPVYAKVENNKIVHYRINAKISFVIKH